MSDALEKLRAAAENYINPDFSSLAEEDHAIQKFFAVGNMRNLERHFLDACKPEVIMELFNKLDEANMYIAHLENLLDGHD